MCFNHLTSFLFACLFIYSFTISYIIIYFDHIPHPSILSYLPLPFIFSVEDPCTLGMCSVTELSPQAFQKHLHLECKVQWPLHAL